MAGSTSLDPSHFCVDAHSHVPQKAGLLKGDTATTTIQPYALPNGAKLRVSGSISHEQ